MRILIISNFYPPYSIGGYEIGCRDVASGLTESGHRIHVLTSRYGSSADPDERIERTLFHTLPPGGLGGPRSRLSIMLDPLRHWRNRARIRRAIARHRPDVIFLWNLSLLGHWIFNDPHVTSVPTVCYVSDEWLSSLPEDSGAFPSFEECHGLLNYANQASTRLLNRLGGIDTRWPPSSVPAMIFTSRFISDRLQERWGPLPETQIVHWGVNDQFIAPEIAAREWTRNEFRIVYAGQIIGFKGVRTAILAVAELVRRHPRRAIRFHLAGDGPQTFREEMNKLVRETGLSDTINFLGRIDRPQLVSEFSQADACVFPSEWNEPFSISLLEAMASGCPVVATPTGGSGEILKDQINSLVFTPADPDSLADHLELLLYDPDLGRRLGNHAANEVKTSFRLSEMIQEIERTLIRLLDPPPTLPSA